MGQLISIADYSAIAGYYGNIKTVLSSASTYLYNAVYKIAQIDDIEPSIDLLQDFYNSYKVNSAQYSSDLPLLAAVRKLNTHVLNRGGYASIDAFLEANAATVPQSWATLSGEAGQTIDEDNISG
jgi:hypothetical protein